VLVFEPFQTLEVNAAVSERLAAEIEGPDEAGPGS